MADASKVDLLPKMVELEIDKKCQTSAQSQEKGVTQGSKPDAVSIPSSTVGLGTNASKQRKEKAVVSTITANIGGFTNVRNPGKAFVNRGHKRKTGNLCDNLQESRNDQMDETEISKAIYPSLDSAEDTQTEESTFPELGGSSNLNESTETPEKHIEVEVTENVNEENNESDITGVSEDYKVTTLNDEPVENKMSVIPNSTELSEKEEPFDLIEKVDYTIETVPVLDEITVDQSEAGYSQSNAHSSVNSNADEASESISVEYHNMNNKQKEEEEITQEPDESVTIDLDELMVQAHVEKPPEYVEPSPEVSEQTSETPEPPRDQQNTPPEEQNVEIEEEHPEQPSPPAAQVNVTAPDPYEIRIRIADEMKLIQNLTRDEMEAVMLKNIKKRRQWVIVATLLGVLVLALACTTAVLAFNLTELKDACGDPNYL